MMFLFFKKQLPSMDLPFWLGKGYAVCVVELGYLRLELSAFYRPESSGASCSKGG